MFEDLIEITLKMIIMFDREHIIICYFQGFSNFVKKSPILDIAIMGDVMITMFG